MLRVNYLGSKVAADRGRERNVVHRMNEEYKTSVALKTGLSNKGLVYMRKSVCIRE